MNKIILCFVLSFATYSIQSQAIYENFHSSKLNEDRQLKILLPRGYDEENSKKYPLIIVFDGDYLFEAVAGNVD
jgi:enterochelin esterase-like enzyme